MTGSVHFRSFVIHLLFSALIIAGCTPELGCASNEDKMSRVEIPPTATPAPSGEPGVLIYVLDLGDRTSTPFAYSRIIAYEPDSQRVAYILHICYARVPLLSPDSTRLYVAASFPARGVRDELHVVLSIYDASTGKLIVDDHPIPGRAHPKGAPEENRFLFFSAGGEKLFLVKYGAPPNTDDLRVAELDPASLLIMDEYAWPGTCTHLVQALVDRWLYASHGRLVLLDPVRDEIREELDGFDVPGSVTASIRSPGDEYAYLILQAGSDAILLSIELTAGRVSTLHNLSAPQGWAYNSRHFALAQDGALLYINISRQQENTGYHHRFGACASRMGSWLQRSILEEALMI